jgi:endonuclease/exonuclease/phosphatase (EEP) superfamily protein YafD
MSEPIKTSSLSPIRRWQAAAGNLIQTCILVYGLSITGYLLARFAAGERWRWIAFANNFVPWWALGNIAAGGIALLSRRRVGLIAAQMPGIAAFLVLYGDLLLPADTPAEATHTPPITAATYNIISVTSDPQRVQDVILSLDADIIGLQEVGPDHARQFADQLSGVYPYQVMHPGLPYLGVGLLSRYPIVEETMFQPLPGAMYYLRATLDINGAPVVVYVAHPPPPREWLSPFTYDDSRRNAEVDRLLADYLARETGAVIVMGDFNMTDQSDAYRRMDKRFDDVFRVAGRGLGFTFPDMLRSSLRVLPLMLRIDYIWYNDAFIVHAVRTGEDSGTSDHRPVIAELGLLAAQRSD